jgi:hypothetical protein
MALLTFDESGATIREIYPEATLEEIDDRMAYRARRPAAVETSAPPTLDELDVIRGMGLPPLPW